LVQRGMSSMNKPPVSNSVGITIKPPEKYSISGDTEVKPTETVVEKEESASDEQFLELLYKHLEAMEQQRQLTINMISIIKKRLGFCCGK